MPKIVDDEGHALKAILLLVMGMSFIPLNDALIKVMSERLPLAEIVALRAVMSLGILIIFTKGVRSVSMLDRKTIILFVIRGMCLVAAMYLYFLALSTLPISTVVSIFFLSPLLITALSSVFLNEKIGAHRLTAVLLALMGVALIMRPGTSFFKFEMLLALGSAVSYAIFQVVTRRLKGMGDLPGLITIQHLCYLVSALPFVAYNMLSSHELSGNQALDFLLRKAVLPTFVEVTFFAICACAVLFLSFASSYAYRNAEASLVAPFEYVAIPVSVLWGIFIWNEWPDTLSWLGMFLILLGGIYAVYRERRLNIRVASDIPMPASTGMNMGKNQIK
jgi:drug/metabolite transporter (DMT)-like permease